MPYYQSDSGKTGRTEDCREFITGCSSDIFDKPYSCRIYQFPSAGEPGAGNSKWAHIATGLQDTESAPGWYNTYNTETFVENKYDTDATAKASQENIRESLQHFAEDPEYAWSFFNRKWAIQWNNPTFECFTL